MSNSRTIARGVSSVISRGPASRFGVGEDAPPRAPSPPRWIPNSTPLRQTRRPRDLSEKAELRSARSRASGSKIELAGLYRGRRGCPRSDDLRAHRIAMYEAKVGTSPRIEVTQREVSERRGYPRLPGEDATPRP